VEIDVLMRRVLSKEYEILIPNSDHEIPEMTAEVAKAAFPRGNAVQMRSENIGRKRMALRLD